MAVKIAPNARRQFINASGVPYSGAKLFYYAAGSSTKQNTYTTSVGNIANSNPIVLDSAGRTPYGVWFTAGLTYKEVLAPSTDTDPPSSPIFTEDNISGVNDTSVTVSQWAASSLTPTYISTTSFSVPGDQTTELHVGRRLQFTVTAGTVYGRISVSAYTTLTTITVVMDSVQTLDSGLTSFNWSILAATNHALPKLSSTDLTAIGVADTASYATKASPTFTGTVTIPTVAISAGTITGITDLAIADGGTGASTAAAAFLNIKQAASESATGAIEIAASTEVATATDALRAVPPAYMHMHPNSAKAWATFDGTTGTSLSAQGITSISRVSTGLYTITFNFTFLNTFYAMIGNAEDANSTGATLVTRHPADTKTTTVCQIRTFADDGSLADASQVYISFFGYR